MRQCDSFGFFVGAGIAKLFHRLYPQMKAESSRELTPESVLAFYDHCSQRWLFNLLIKRKYFYQTFRDALKDGLAMMRHHAVTHGLDNLQLLELRCGLDKIQHTIVHKILREVFQKNVVSITTCTRRHSKRTVEQTTTKMNWKPPSKITKNSNGS